MHFPSSINEHQLRKLVLKFLLVEGAVASLFSVDRGDGFGRFLVSAFVQWLSVGMDYELGYLLRVFLDDLLVKRGGERGGLMVG